VGITPPQQAGFSSGLSVAFSLGALHKLEEGAIVDNVAALHVSIGHGDVPSVSTEIAALRRILLHPPKGDGETWYRKVAQVNTSQFQLARLTFADAV
jgi:hypothetical protein